MASHVNARTIRARSEVRRPSYREGQDLQFWWAREVDCPLSPELAIMSYAPPVLEASDRRESPRWRQRSPVELRVVRIWQAERPCRSPTRRSSTSQGLGRTARSPRTALGFMSLSWARGRSSCCCTGFPSSGGHGGTRASRL